MDIADIVKDLFDNTDLCAFHHYNKINTNLKWQMVSNSVSYKGALS